MMNQSQLEQLDDSELIEEIHHTKDILDLCVSGVLNQEFQADPEGVYWVKEDLHILTEELERRFMNKDNRGHASNDDMNTEDSLKVFMEGLRVLRLTDRDRANAYLDRLLDVLLEAKESSQT